MSQDKSQHDGAETVDLSNLPPVPREVLPVSPLLYLLWAASHPRKKPARPVRPLRSTSRLLNRAKCAPLSGAASRYGFFTAQNSRLKSLKTTTANWPIPIRSVPASRRLMRRTNIAHASPSFSSRLASVHTWVAHPRPNWPLNQAQGCLPTGKAASSAPAMVPHSTWPAVFTKTSRRPITWKCHRTNFRPTVAMSSSVSMMTTRLKALFHIHYRRHS